MILLYKIIDFSIRTMQLLIFINILLSWIAPNSRNEFTALVHSLTEPILKPFRMTLPIGNMRMDLSPIIAYYVLNFIRRIVFSILF